MKPRSSLKQVGKVGKIENWSRAVGQVTLNKDEGRRTRQFFILASARRGKSKQEEKTWNAGCTLFSFRKW